MAKITEEQIREILEIIVKVKEEAGQKVVFAELYEGSDTGELEDPKILIDNRDKDQIN